MRNEGLIEDIKTKIDIVHFISEYIQLKKSGQNWKGLCPFHTEKTPSFMVHPTKQIFHCFGCGVGGDIISFIMKYENLSFHEAKTLLAQRAGIQLPVRKGNKKALQRSEQIRNAYAEALSYYMSQLRKSQSAMTYLRKRGINEVSLESFKLGYAPGGWSNLLKHLRHVGFNDALIKEAGLAVSGGRGLYDMFRNRIIFPILSPSGKVVAFGGRALDNAMPKYINSSETVIFKKSDTLFGLFSAKEEISGKDCALLVEGYMDVIICHQHGFKNVIAPLGTALTSGQLQKLRRLTNKIVLVFDGDTAGIAAARRALPLVSQNDFRARVLLLPKNEDPDSYLNRHGRVRFNKAIEESQSVIDFILAMTDKTLNETVREALILIAEIHDVLLAEEMLLAVAQRTGFNESTLREEFKKIKGRYKKNDIAHTGTGISSGNREEYILLSTIIAFPEKTDYVLSRINLNDIKDTTVCSLFRRITTLQDKQNVSLILDQASDEEKRIFSKLSLEPGFALEYVDRNIEECLEKMDQRKIDEQMKRAATAGDFRLFNSLLHEKKRFIRERG